jgi:predicted nucleic acid-binding protein
MDVLIDTNVALDALLEREPYYENAMKIIAVSEDGGFRSYVSASAVTDIFYIARNQLKSKKTAIELLKEMLKTVRVATVTQEDVHKALYADWSDFEDSLAHIVGQSVSARYIITRNPSDFKDSQIEIISPEAFLNKLITNSK